VVYSGGLIEITANNASLNRILRDIARETGMKITGGVADQRVFGKYGPAAPAVVLADLLDGTGSNMFFRQGEQDQPAELILTARGGGPTPPNPNAAAFDDDSEPSPPQAAAPSSALPPRSQPSVPRLPFSTPAQTPAITSTDLTPTTPPAAGFVSAPTVDPQTEPGTTPGPNTQSTGTSDPASPNGVKTPEQIYQQLQDLRQQQLQQLQRQQQQQQQMQQLLNQPPASQTQ
jgi:hypothetical protein